MRRQQLLVLVCLAAAVAQLQQHAAHASSTPIRAPGPGGAQPTAAAQAAALQRRNEAIATAAAASIAANQPTRMLVTFRVPEQAVADQAGAISTSAGAASPGDVLNAARKQANAAVKSRVLGPAAAAAAPSSGRGRVVDERGGASATAAAPGGGVAVVTDYTSLPVTLVSVSSAAQLAALRAHPDVASVVADGVVRPMGMNGLELIGQPDVLLQRYAGAGTVVVMDTGLDYTNLAFGPCTAPGVPASCSVLFSKDFAADDGALDTGDFHGTNVAAIIVGVAPGARLIGLDVFDADGSGAWSTLIAAINWAVDSKAKYNITAANLSLGGGKYDTACDDQPLAAAINTAFAAGIVSAVAAGNDGYIDSLSAPACASTALSVGAVFSADVQDQVSWAVGCTQVNPKRDEVVCFTNSNAQLKLLAPGFDIQAAGILLSGTSQATPFAAAALAVLQQRFPAFSPGQLVAQLTGTGAPVTDQRNGLVKPRLDLRAAVGLPAAAPPCTATLTPAAPSAAAAGGAAALQVAASAPSCAWRVSLPAGASWLRVAGSSNGTGSGAVSLQVDANAGVARSAVVTLTAAGGSVTATLAQAAGSGGSGGGNEGGPKPPVQQGGIRGVPARTSVVLSWAPAVAAGARLAEYRVVFRAGLRAPRPHCADGTPVARRATLVSTNTRGAMQYRVRVADLQPGQQYAFRVCGMQAGGTLASGAVWRGSTRP